MRHRIQGNKKVARKRELHWRTGPDGKYCLGCLFNLAHDKVMGSDLLASSLTPTVIQCKYCSIFLRLICSGSTKSLLFRKTLAFLEISWWRFHHTHSSRAVLEDSGGRRACYPPRLGTRQERFPAWKIPHHFSQVLSEQVHSHPNLIFPSRKSTVGPRGV